MHCAGFLLLCMTTFAPRIVENLRVHKLTLLHENLTQESLYGYGYSLSTDTKILPIVLHLTSQRLMASESPPPHTPPHKNPGFYSFSMKIC